MTTSALLLTAPTTSPRSTSTSEPGEDRHVGYGTVDQLGGCTASQRKADPDAYERANYLQGLISFANSFRSDGG